CRFIPRCNSPRVANARILRFATPRSIGRNWIATSVPTAYFAARRNPANSPSALGAKRQSSPPPDSYFFGEFFLSLNSGNRLNIFTKTAKHSYSCCATFPIRRRSEGLFEVTLHSVRLTETNNFETIAL